MSGRPLVLVRMIPGGGVALALEFPPGVRPGPVVLSDQQKDQLIIELTGRHPVPDWVRLPGTLVLERAGNCGD